MQKNKGETCLRQGVAPRALSALSHGKKRHKDASAVRLELTQAEPIAFRVQPLNRSGTLTIWGNGEGGQADLYGGLKYV